MVQNYHETKNQITGFFTADVPMAQLLATRNLTVTADRRHDEGASVFVSLLAWLSNCTVEGVRDGWMPAPWIDVATTRFTDWVRDGWMPAPCIDVTTTRHATNSSNHGDPTMLSNEVLTGKGALNRNDIDDRDCDVFQFIVLLICVVISGVRWCHWRFEVSKHVINDTASNKFMYRFSGSKSPCRRNKLWWIIWLALAAVGGAGRVMPRER
jgi:hypothetical protein